MCDLRTLRSGERLLHLLSLTHSMFNGIRILSLIIMHTLKGSILQIVSPVFFLSVLKKIGVAH